MKGKKIKKLISVLIVLSMVLGIFPALALPVYAEGNEEANGVTVTSWHSLKTALSSLETREKVILGANIKYEYQYDMDNLDGAANLIKIFNKKSLDLNGYKIELVDQSTRSRKTTEKELAVFFINQGGNLHVFDSKGGGEVWHHSQLSEKAVSLTPLKIGPGIVCF